eukprot:CAMPEP_0197679854 /NCGR_PEP_ID=MMETSP1338-20131121/92345_1 /TAXON_ID=43686 ORGANISM="Pelagodinium beii, Strain RCC1491" /NCGR_SAMPLE_ID=MMETSP1338 /ASSEMBLY_ACC=CAM_ASM_000754 /LENGTH=92 /DNA_ID=CAMNT_0043260955 /DNA_START=195 /DNA_END=474 /DNA_ORIENTATION=-
MYSTALLTHYALQCLHAALMAPLRTLAAQQPLDRVAVILQQRHGCARAGPLLQLPPLQIPEERGARLDDGSGRTDSLIGTRKAQIVPSLPTR